MTTRLVSVQSGRPCVSERWGISLFDAAALFQYACASARHDENPLHAMDALAATWRAIGADLAQELPA
jgi:hypothetical protein